MNVDVRWATAGDAGAIIAMVRQARLNPSNLDWRRFVVGETDGTIVGAAQVRQYSDGARELASLVVQPSHRRHGVATALIDVLLRDERGELFALVDRRYAHHFRRWGFAVVGPAQLPRSLSRVYVLGLVVTSAVSVMTMRRIRIVPLRRPAR